MRSEEAPYVGHCGFCEQGLLRLMRCDGCQAIAAVCDECELAWNDVAGVSVDPKIASASSHPHCPACHTSQSSWNYLDAESVDEADLRHLCKWGGEE